MHFVIANQTFSLLKCVIFTQFWHLFASNSDWLYNEMPECSLGLNNRALLEARGQTKQGRAINLDEDIKFHHSVTVFLFSHDTVMQNLLCFRCVWLGRLENGRTMSFLQPDGSFELMNYKPSTQVCLLYM